MPTVMVSITAPSILWACTPESPRAGRIGEMSLAG